jgi:hypothetical protein
VSRIFVTIPRFQTGVPITLGVVKGQTSTGVAIVYPYPEYSWQSSQDSENCEGHILSVFRIAVSY